MYYIAVVSKYQRQSTSACAHIVMLPSIAGAGNVDAGHSGGYIFGSGVALLWEGGV